jgi:hypothetical protein
MRIALALALMIASGVSLGGATVAVEHDTDPITGDDRSFAWVTTPTYATSGSSGGVLYVRCVGDFDYEAFIEFTVFLDSENDVRVTYRFDDGEAIDAEFRSTFDGSTLFVPADRVADWLRALRASHRFSLRATTFRGVDHTLVFELEDFGEAIGELGCLPS